MLAKVLILGMATAEALIVFKEYRTNAKGEKKLSFWSGLHILAMLIFIIAAAFGNWG